MQLPLGERVKTAGDLAVRARVHFDLWAITAMTEGRTAYREAIEDYWEVLRFGEHAQLLAFIVTLYNLLDDRKGTIRLRQLSRELGGVAGDRLASLAPVVDKLRWLRSNLFAHRSDSVSYSEAFKRADTTPNLLRDAADEAIAIAALMAAQVGVRGPIRAELPPQFFERMLANLQRADQS